MKLNFYKSLIALFLMQTAGTAAVLLDQPIASVDGRASSTSTGSDGFQTWERFSLTGTAHVTRISWIGAFIDTSNLANNPVAPVGTSWNFALANDSGNSPGTVVGSETQTFGSVAAALLGSGTLAGQPVSLYTYTADLVSPMLIQGGQTMWLSIFQQNSSLQPVFGWFSGSGGDGVSKQFLNSNGSLVATYTDRALKLEGNEVPEPGSVALMGLGGALLVVLQRRR